MLQERDDDSQLKTGDVRADPAREGEELIVVYTHSTRFESGWRDFKGFASPLNPYQPVVVPVGAEIQIARDGTSPKHGIVGAGGVVVVDERSVSVDELGIGTSVVPLLIPPKVIRERRRIRAMIPGTRPHSRPRPPFSL